MFYVRARVHTSLVNKFDPDATLFLMAIADAEDRHPDRSDGPPTRFSIWDQPLVKVRDVYGRAVEYTPSYGLIAWWDDAKAQHLEWFPAGQINRVASKDWHGN